MYTTNKIETHLFWKAILCVVFFLLSPCLPAFEWVLQKVQNHNLNVLTVYPGCDGLLLWFEQELRANELFILETVFESSIQVIIQCISAFVLPNLVFKNVYLYPSISISLIVILSKFILISYNNKRKIILLNLLSYSLDVFFSLVYCIFIGAFIFQKIFTFIGLYIIFEFLVVMPVFAHYISNKLSMPPLLSLISLFIFWCPATICALSAFSLYPILIFLWTNPRKVGRNQIFHQKLYEYCCNSKDADEFDNKLITINYACMEYTDDLDNAEWLENFQAKGSNKWIDAYKLQDFDSRKYVQGSESIENLKILQIIMRTIFTTFFALMDTFYLGTFENGSAFMNKYQNIIMLFTGIGILLFVIWFCLVMQQLFWSKWNRFCRYMVISKFDSFILTTTEEEFIHKCDRLLRQKKVKDRNVRKHMRLVRITKEVNEKKKTKPVTFIDLISTCIQSILIIVMSFVAVGFDGSEQCRDSEAVISIYNTIINSLIICISIIKLFVAINDVLVEGMIFASFSSQIIVYCHMVFFYENEGCHLHIVWILLLVATLVTPIKVWTVSLSVWIGILYVINEYQGLDFVVTLVVGLSGSVLILCCVAVVFIVRKTQQQTIHRENSREKLWDL
eukprot:808_1